MKRSKQFFFEKKNQKTFANLAFGLGRLTCLVAKVFASFFKKKRFLTPALRSTAPMAIILLTATTPQNEQSLLAALKAAPNESAAAAVEQRLQLLWHDQASQAVQVLIDRAVLKQRAGKWDDALADGDAAIVLQPEVADLWRRRAEAKYHVGDEAGAMADLAQALVRDPDCIPALVDISEFAEARHDNKRALAAWQKVLQFDPKTPHGATRLEQLQHKLLGQPI